MNKVIDVDVTSSTVHSCRDTCFALAMVMPKSGRRKSSGAAVEASAAVLFVCLHRPRTQPGRNSTMDDDDDDDNNDNDDDDELPPTRCKPSILGDFGGCGVAAAVRGGRCGRSWWVGPAFVLLRLPPLPLLLPPTTAGIWCLLLFVSALLMVVCGRCVVSHGRCLGGGRSNHRGFIGSAVRTRTQTPLSSTQ